MQDGTTGEPFGQAEDLFHRALAISPQERPARLKEWCRGNPKLLDDVLSLLTGYERSEGIAAFAATTAADPWIGRRVGPYQIERLLGSGGTGAVYFASRNDGEFRMQVAVKVLANRVTGAATLDRFELERQILASLNHPHIARLIDGGVTSAGEAYLVMEYVEGEPLDAWAARRRPDLRELLGVFLLVCGAVEHAHRNLILHRDLKPGNILVNTEGQPKVLDFGNAKLLDADSPEERRRLTQLGFRAFTPEFAAPEQILGGTVSAACDVYSLGVVLYGLVAGKPPYVFRTWSSAEFVEVLRDFDPQPPGAGADIDAIVMKALRKEPERRYPTIAAFAADLRAFLQARPVSAREWTVGYRARKFLRRRRNAMVAAGLVAALLLAGVSATAWQARRARAEERRAYAQFRTARELVRGLLFDTFNAVQELPGSLDVQRALVTESTLYVDRLWSDSPQDPDAAMDAVEAYLRLGNLQGNPYSDNLSEPDAALRTLQKAGQAAATLAAARPGDARVQRLVALTEQSLGEVYFGRHEVASAVEHMEKSEALFAKLASSRAASASLLLEAASVCGTLGDAVSGSNGGTGDVARAQALFQRQQALQHRALALEPANERAGRGLAVAGMKLANLLSEARPSEAVRLLNGALQQLAGLPEAARRSMSNLRLEAMIRTRLAGTLPGLGDYDGGAEHAFQAVRLYESAAAIAPDNARSKTDLLNAWYYYAESLDYRGAETRRTNDLEQALKSYRAALELCRSLLDAAPDNTLWKSRAAELQFRIGRLSLALRDTVGAEAALRNARALTIETADRLDAGETELARAAIMFSSEEVPMAWRDVPRARRYMDRLMVGVASPSPHHLYTLARICRLEGRPAEGANLIARAESLLPAAEEGQPKSYLRRQIEEEKARLNAVRSAPRR
jgi:tetratricopeptide (TPR) repeat protein/predicted Ser/Thr protein kinase